MKQLISSHEKKSIILFILITFLFSRVSFYLISGLLMGEWDLSVFLVNMNRWDALWYRRYVEDILNGQMTILEGRGEASWAFFPLYPLLLTGIWKLLRLKHSVILIGSAVSSLCFMLFEYVAYRYIMVTRKSLQQAYWYIFFMSFGLYSFYFSITYTESLFLLLLSLCFLFLYEKKYVRMGLCGILLTFTRGTGIFFAFVILVKVIVDYVEKQAVTADYGGNISKREKAGLFLRRVFGFIPYCLSDVNLIFGTCLLPLGMFTYMAFLKWYTGDGFAFMHVQISWGRGTGRNIFQIFWDEFTRQFPPSYLSVSVIISLLIIVVAMVKEKRYAEMMLPIFTMIANCTSSLNSNPRYMIGSFTVALVLTDFFMKMKKPGKTLWTIFLVLAEGAFVLSWMQGNVYLC